ncbi:MAG: alcohol dehydrogenase catalytic domain-containing protein [Planctomycetota bacterium]
MRALTFRGVRDVVVVDQPEPTLQSPTDAIVAVDLAGLCGSDLHPYRGHEVGLDPGTTMGHEFTGRIVALGEEVTGLRIGDAVLSPFSTACGRCAPCRRGLSARCSVGELFGWRQGERGLHGGQAALVRVPLAASTLLRRPDSVSAVDALLLGDVATTGAYVVRRALRVADDPQAAVVVLGCGAVGLAAVLHAKQAGARNVFAVDRRRARLELAASFGAIPIELDDRAGRPRQSTDLAAELHRIEDADAIGVAIDAVGHPSAMELAVELLRPGGVLGIAGVHTSAHFAVSPETAYGKNLTLFCGRCPVRSQLDSMLREHVARPLPLTRLVTHRFALDDAAAAYRDFDRGDGGIVKAVFDPSA